MGDSPAAIVFDTLGHPVGVIQDGVIYRLQVESKPKPTNTSTTSVDGSNVSVTLLADNNDRVGAAIFNESSADLYVKLGATASINDYSVKLVSGAYFELPYGYTGVIDGIWGSATGNARITEFS